MEITAATIKKFGILEGSTVSVFKPWSISDFARMLIKLAMKEEGLKFNDEGRFKYIESWVETLIECANGEPQNYNVSNVSDQIADNLIYSRYHIIDMSNRTSITSEIKNIIYNEIVAILDKTVAAFVQQNIAE
ncbi:MAG: hypothetical protein WC979_00215 [Candidatus Pacearchaeota archaeon]|jgi:hypothetical protein|nr:hypothetical protein [Clostridia bacterium]